MDQIIVTANNSSRSLVDNCWLSCCYLQLLLKHLKLVKTRWSDLSDSLVVLYLMYRVALLASLKSVTLHTEPDVSLFNLLRVFTM